MAYFTIGYDASTTLSRRTGIGRAVLELFRAMVALEDDRFEFNVLLSSLLKKPSIDHEFLKQSDQVTVYRSRRPGSWMVRKWATGKGPFVEDLVGDVGLFHAPASYIPPTKKARRIVSVYDIAFLEEPAASREPLGGALFEKSFPKILPKCEAVVTSSDYTRQRLIDKYSLSEDQVFSIPLAVDHDIFHPAPERHVEIAVHSVGLHKGDFLLSVTSHQHRKRNWLLLEIYERLLEMHPETPPLVVIGWDGKPPKELKAKPHLHRHIFVLERVPEETLPGLYTTALATILTSSHEGFGFPVLEANACGSPVVCANSSSLPEVGGGAATYMDGEDPQAWADEVSKLMFDQEYRNEKSEQSIQNAERFNWKDAAQQMLDLYTKL